MHISLGQPQQMHPSNKGCNYKYTQLQVLQVNPGSWQYMYMYIAGYGRLMAYGDYWGLIGIYLAAINP